MNAWNAAAQSGCRAREWAGSRLGRSRSKGFAFASSDPHENRNHPAGSFLYGTSLLHCMTVSLAYDGEGLGAMWGEQKARELLSEAGFGWISVHPVDGDNFNDFFGARV